MRWYFRIVETNKCEDIDEADLMDEGGFNVDFATDIVCDRVEVDAATLAFERVWDDWDAGHTTWQVSCDGISVAYIHKRNDAK